MKALTLTQPWATLIAIGAKRIETRDWWTAYRGPIAIHAAKAFPGDAKDLCYSQGFRQALGWPDPEGRINQPWLNDINARIKALPLGTIIAMYAWILDDVKMLPEPIPAKGMLGLWEWEPPALPASTELLSELQPKPKEGKSCR